MRIKIIRIVIAFLFLIIAVDLMYVQIIRGSYFYRLSKNNRVRIVPLEGWRGTIKDRNGKVLATNRISYNVMVTPQDIEDMRKLFGFLSEVLNIKTEVLIKRYRQKKYAPFAPVVVAADIFRDKAIVIEENKYRFPSLFVQKSFKRYYPMGQKSAHVLGYVGKVSRAETDRLKEYGYSPQSIMGKSGVEEYYDSYLKGDVGGQQIEVDSRGKQVRLLGLKKPIKGEDITLTIDSDIQELCVKLLAGRAGSILLMDMDNGEIFGLTSMPSYDPNVFVDIKKKNIVSGLFKHPEAPLINRAIQGVFPPGSIFKIVDAVAGLATKKISDSTSFSCSGVYMLGKASFRCAHVHGSQTLIEAIAHSCNVYFFHIGKIMGSDMLNHYARLLGLGNLTNVDLPYEEHGSIPSRGDRARINGRQWFTGDTLNMSIGQGDVLTTPLQLVSMMTTVAKEGVSIQPHIIKEIGDTDVNEYPIEQRVRIPASVFATVNKGLRAAVADFAGTARILNIKGLYVAGKTGTAQTSGGRDHHAWFVGYAKGSKRNISFSVFLEFGGSSYNACVVARDLLKKLKKKKFL